MTKPSYPTIRRPFDRTPHVLKFPTPSRTKQSFKDECDVNYLLSHYGTTGLMTHLATGTPSYGDFTNPTDYLEASQAVLSAQDAFANLPAELRDRFKNNPAHLLAFLHDPANLEEGRSLGLIEPEAKAPGPIKVEVTNQPETTQHRTPKPGGETPPPS